MTKDWQHRYRSEKKKESQKEFDGWSRQDLIDHILDLRERITEDEAGGTLDDQKLTKESYNQGWSYPTKIAFLIKVNAKPLTTDDLEAELLKLDKHFKDYTKPRNNLTVTLSRAIKSGRIKKIKVPGIRNLYYVLPDWVSKEGELKEQFHFIYDTFQ